MNRKGIALIMAVGVLAILATIATSFALNMRLEYRAAVNYSNGVKARYFAEAALARAIAELRTHVKSSVFDDLDEDWALDTHPTNHASLYNNYSLIEGDKTAAPPRITSNGSSYVELISDEQRKVNINAANTLLLSNLVLKVFPSWNSGTVNAFVGKITGHLPCSNLNELMMDVPSGSNNHIEKADLDSLRRFITVNSYRDPNCGNRAPINVNTCDQEVLYSVFKGVEGDTGGPVNSTQAGNLATAVINARPITNWSDFNNVITAGIADAKRRAAVKDNCNPNRTKPTEANTTEFCFNSGGYYTVTATGTVMDLLNVSLASRTLSATVKLYDIYCETTKAQFALGTPVRVTWFDSCPVASDDLFGSYSIPADATTINNSLKLGFWDNFDEDLTYSGNEWIAASGTRVFNDADGDSDFEITDQNLLQPSLTWGNYRLNDSAKWTWSNVSARAFCYDMESGTQMRHVGWLFFRGGNVALHTCVKPLEWGNDCDSHGGREWAYENPSGSGTVVFWDDACAIANGRNPATDKCTYPPGQVRFFPGSNNNTSSDKTNLAYETKKTHNVFSVGSSATDTVYTASGASATFSGGGLSSASGIAAVCGSAVKVAWDDIRIISPDGNLTSQTINSTLSPGMTGNVEWGTITGTLTIPSTASATETVTYQTKSSADGGTWKDASPTTGGDMTSVAGSSIQYKALLATADPQINETPVLEDITITYLPKVQIRSFSLSN